MKGCFIAVPIPDDITTWFRDLQIPLARLPGIRRFQDPVSAHITLRYFGDLTNDDIGFVRDALTPIAASMSPLQLRIYGWGAFGISGAPHVLYLRVEAPPELTALAHRTHTLPVGRHDTDPFLAHVTVLRTSDAKIFGDAWSTVEATIPTPRHSFIADRLRFYVAPSPGRTQIPAFDLSFQGNAT